MEKPNLKKKSLGREFEKEFFGENAVFNDRFLMAYIEDRKRYIADFDECLYEAKKYTQQRIGWNTKDPSTALAQFLFQNVKNCLPARFHKELELFCAIGSRLDYFHGVDAFFTIGSVIVTIDLSLSKTKETKADILVYKKKYYFFPYLKRVARQIADILLDRLGSSSAVT